MSAGVAGHVPVEAPGEHVKQNRRAERERRSKLQQPQDRRKQQQQDNVERQYVHVGRLEFKQQRLDDRHVGLLEKIENVHFLGIERVLEAGGDVGNFGEVDREQEHVGNIDLPGSPQDVGAQIGRAHV